MPGVNGAEGDGNWEAARLGHKGQNTPSSEGGQMGTGDGNSGGVLGGKGLHHWALGEDGDGDEDGGGG